MHWKKIFSTVFLVMFQLFTFVLLAQSANFPVPSGNSNQLFYLQRTPNTNTIVCELNLINGKLDTETPIHVFWLRYGDKGQREELAYIQRKFAYGISNRKIAENQYEQNSFSLHYYFEYGIIFLVFLFPFGWRLVAYLIFLRTQHEAPKTYHL